MNTSSSESIAYLGLGSNLDSPVDQINKARISIRGINRVTELVFSSLYVSAPMGPQNQPDYVNAVMAISTTLSPMALLNELQAIERSQGRIRGDQRWCARTLDLDLLLYGDQEIDLPRIDSAASWNGRSSVCVISSSRMCGRALYTRKR